MMKAVIINVLKISAFVYICSFVNYVVSTNLEDDYGEMTEDQVSQCFKEIACELGEEARHKFMECVNGLPPKELNLAFDWFKDYDPPFVFTGDPEEKVQKLCDVDNEMREKLFDQFLVSYVDHMSQKCANPFQKDLCDAWTTITDCSYSLDREYFKRKECGQN